MKEIQNIVDFYDSVRRDDVHLALAEVVLVEGSSYRRIGARMLISSDGRWVGGISGGCLEGDALKKAQRAIHSGKPTLVVYDTLDSDSQQIGVGLGCRGKIEVLFCSINRDDPQNDIELLRAVTMSTEAICFVRVVESNSEMDLIGQCALIEFEDETPSFPEFSLKDIVNSITELRKSRKSVLKTLATKKGECRVLFSIIEPRPRLLLIGNQYDIEPTVRIARELDWEIDIAGNVSKLSKECVKMAYRVIAYDSLSQKDLSEHTAIILMTHDYAKDLEILPILLRLPDTYIGVLGPKKRFSRLVEELNTSVSENVFAPVGLDVGAQTPEEIAIAMIAEIIAWQRGRTGISLRKREFTIYER